VVIQPDGYKLRAYEFSDPYPTSPFIVKVSNSKDSLIGLFSFTDEEYIMRHEIFQSKYPRKYKHIETELQKNWVNGKLPEPTFKRNFEENLNNLIDLLGYRNDHSKTRVLMDALLVDLLGMKEINWEGYFRSVDQLNKERKRYKAKKSDIERHIQEYRNLSSHQIFCDDCQIYKTQNGGRFGYWVIETSGYPEPVKVKIKFISELFFRPNIRI
jgi:hypothetical protein